jgi:hypothetical protein
MSTPRTPYRAPQPRTAPPRSPQSRTTMRLSELTLHDRDSVYPMPHGADWLWLGLFALVVLGSGAYVWSQTGLESDVGRAVFFASVLLAILWTALIYTLKLSARVAVGPRGLCLVRGPWTTELTWAEVARLAEGGETVGGQYYHWLVAYAYDGRELRIREDMVADYRRFRTEVLERQRLWLDHGGTWGATGGGPFAAEEEVTSLVIWWLIGAGVCLLPGMYFAVLIPPTFVLGVALVGLAAICALMALRLSLGRQTYTVDRRAVVARRTIGTTTLAWSEVTQVQRVRSRAWLPARVGIVIVRGALALASRADTRVRSFTWTPRAPEYLVLRAVGGRRIRVRLHRLARPGELLAWVEFYDRVARQGQGAGQGQGQNQGQERQHRASEPINAPPQPAVPDLGGMTGPADPWAGTRGGDVRPAAGRDDTSTPAPPASGPMGSPAPASSPRVTRPILGATDLDSVDPRILAVIQDVAAAERSRPAATPDVPPDVQPDLQRSGKSDWLNDTLDQSPIPRPGQREPGGHAGSGQVQGRG